LKLKPKDRTRPSLVQAIIDAMSVGSSPSTATSASKNKKCTLILLKIQTISAEQLFFMNRSDLRIQIRRE